MLIPGQAQEDGEPAPGSVRLLHRADVHLIDPMGSEIDVRIHTAHVDQPIGRELLREEHQKCRVYGHHGYDLKQPGNRLRNASPSPQRPGRPTALSRSDRTRQRTTSGPGPTRIDRSRPDSARPNSEENLWAKPIFEHMSSSVETSA